MKLVIYVGSPEKRYPTSWLIGFEKVLLMQTSTNMSVSDIIDTYVYRALLADRVVSFGLQCAVNVNQNIVCFISRLNDGRKLLGFLIVHADHLLVLPL